MKFLFAFMLLALSACVSIEDEQLPFNPDYNRYAQNVTIVKKSSKFITYEYKNIRVDELAALAALYCQEQDNQRAALYDIMLHRNNARRATFVCKKAAVNR